jgi:hypothetical protein
MIRAHEHRAAVSPSIDKTAPNGPAPSTRDLLIEGGDGRLALDPITGRNRYGCSPAPDVGLADFGSSTASVISERGFDAADSLRARLYRAEPFGPSPAAYAEGLERLRRGLIGLYGLNDMSGLDVIFSPSGTDLHLILAELIGGRSEAPLVCIDVEPEETGSGVPAALSGRHFGGHASLGAPVTQGGAIGLAAHRFVAVPCRAADGALRSELEVDAELNRIGREAVTDGARLLLAVSDVSKTGLISPSLATVMAFKARFGDAVEVVIDACQLRLAPESLRAYLAQGFLVAVTGSKFLSGPSFSGALFVPPTAAERLQHRPVSPGLRAYSARGDWPKGWAAAQTLMDTANIGLLLRWEAALAELAAFRALPPAATAAFAARFADAVQARLVADPLFEPLEIRALDRAAIGGGAGWDLTPTIFPFLLRHAPGGRGGLLSLASTTDVYRGLCAEPVPADPSLPRARLGQPVRCGDRDERPISALRLCNSARLMVEAVTGGEAAWAAVIARALAVLDRTALEIRAVSKTGRI